MNVHLVFSLLGSDRTGLVDQISRVVAEEGANLEDARMAVLGGEFAVIMLVRTDAARRERLEQAMGRCAQALGMTLQVKETRAAHDEAARHRFTVTVTGADHEGIVHPIVAWVASQGSSIVNLASQVRPAPHTGIALFSMTLQVEAPAALSKGEAQRQLAGIGDRLNVDVDVEEGSGSRSAGNLDAASNSR